MPANAIWAMLLYMQYLGRKESREILEQRSSDRCPLRLLLFLGVPFRVPVPCSCFSPLSLRIASFPCGSSNVNVFYFLVATTPQPEWKTDPVFSEKTGGNEDSSHSPAYVPRLKCTRYAGARGRASPSKFTVDRDRQLLLKPHHPQCQVRLWYRLDSAL